jgi:6-phosphogluconolactonase/glucosamine-6-phosphate isomerase/deaminase
LIKILDKKKKLFDYLYRNFFCKNKNILISGGTSIKSSMREALKKSKKINCKLILTDERLVSLNSKLRNDNFFKYLIKKKILKKNNFLNYNYKSYSCKKISKINNMLKKIKINDAVMGLGKDGHLASIFDTNYSDQSNFYLVNNSPKKPKKRITIALKNIHKCKNIILIASMKNKAKEIKNIRNNKLLKNNLKKLKLLIF